MTRLSRFSAPLLLLLLACGEPPAPASSSSPASAPPPQASTSAPAPALVPTSLASASTSASAAASTSAPGVDLSKSPVLHGEDGKALPQTEDRPSAESAAFRRRMELLWQAIVADDPEIAKDVFFPVVAYEIVKDIEKPAADWKHRLMKAFSRNIHGYHKKLGEDASKAKLLGVDIDDKRVKWIEPGKEGNKKGYFRVTRNKLRYQDAEGNEKKLEITSLISWRGEWFVVHLDGFK